MSRDHDTRTTAQMYTQTITMQRSLLLVPLLTKTHKWTVIMEHGNLETIVGIPTSHLSYSSNITHAQRHSVLYTADVVLSGQNVLQSSYFDYAKYVHMLKIKLHFVTLHTAVVEEAWNGYKALRVCNSLWQSMDKESVGALYITCGPTISTFKRHGMAQLWCTHGTKALVMVSDHHLC